MKLLLIILFVSISHSIEAQVDTVKTIFMVNGLMWKYNNDPFTSLNAFNIKKVDLLKDSASMKLYNRMSVILITTDEKRFCDSTSDPVMALEGRVVCLVATGRRPKVWNYWWWPFSKHYEEPQETRKERRWYIRHLKHLNKH